MKKDKLTEKERKWLNAQKKVIKLFRFGYFWMLVVFMTCLIVRLIYLIVCWEVYSFSKNDFETLMNILVVVMLLALLYKNSKRYSEITEKLLSSEDE